MKIGSYTIERDAEDDDFFIVKYKTKHVSFKSRLCGGELETVLSCIFIQAETKYLYEES